jgi:large subunit ribosomal protein L25
MTITSEALKATPRTEVGSQQVRRLRRAGHIPAVVYGHKEAVLNIKVTHDDMWRIIRHGSRIVELELNGKSEKCLVREVQWDVFGKEIEHVDFNRVSADERIHITVPVHLKGTAPGIAAGGVLNFVMHQLHIECPAIAVPEDIRVNVGELQLEQAIHVKELTLPPGVKALGDPDAVVVQVVKPAAEAPKTEELATSNEPEVIKKERAEKEEE